MVSLLEIILKNICFGIFCLLTASHVCAWNALGHQLVAQIAYDNLSPNAKITFGKYNQSMDTVYKPLTWINAAVWLDTLRYQDINWFNKYHYIDIPFSEDSSSLPAYPEENAVFAIENAQRLLANKYPTPVDKGLALRILLHVVGDIHQPLHTSTRISKQFPQGDRGGNFVRLPRNRIAKNLHAYWDRGGGLLKPKRRYSQEKIEELASRLQKKWSCRSEPVKTTPLDWAIESHAIAESIVYKKLTANLYPNKSYQKLTQKITEHQLALAGCRLARLLNHLA
jgi:hypothetical protein